MPEEQEPVSLSDDALDDTIKIKRVKLPLNGLNTNNTLNEQDTHDTCDANGNGYHANENILVPSAPANHPFFDAMAEEETAKMPVLQPDGYNKIGLDAENESLQASPVIEETAFDAKADDPAVGAQFIAPSSPASAPSSLATTPSSLAPVSSLTPLTPVPASQMLPTQQSAQPRNLPLPLRPVVRLWKFSRLLCIAIVLIPISAGCFYAYIQLNQSQSNLYTVDAHTGNVLWQQPEQPTQTATSIAQTELVDTQGSVQIATVANNGQQLIALDAHGTVQWQSFASDGTFALPPVQSATGTVLATLSKKTATGNTLTLYSFNRATGHSNWQYTITQSAQVQSTDIMGADTHFIYVESVQPLAGSQTQVQLLAINQYTGYIGWRVNSPAEPDGTPLDKGTLLLSGQILVWQVEATIQVIDATQGTTLWTHTMPYNNIATFQQEEAQMVILHGQLVVERNNSLHAFDLSTGSQLWNVSVFEFATGTTPASIAVASQAILVYGNGEIEAIALSNQHVIWQQREMGNILGFHVSDDGTLIYVILLDSVEGSAPTQALVAFDAQNGAARWTFQPYSQINFLDPQSNGFQYHRGIILTSLCLSAVSKNTCDHPRLYALNAATGDTLWKFDGNSISNPLLSADGKIVTYEGNTNAWQQFIAGLRG